MNKTKRALKVLDIATLTVSDISSLIKSIVSSYDMSLTIPDNIYDQYSQVIIDARKANLEAFTSKPFEEHIVNISTRIVERYKAHQDCSPGAGLHGPEGVIFKILKQVKHATQRPVTSGGFKARGVAEKSINALVTAHTLGQIDLLEEGAREHQISEFTAHHAHAWKRHTDYEPRVHRTHSSCSPAASKLQRTMLEDEDHSPTLPYRQGYWKR